MQGYLAAVQAGLDPADYQSEAAFREAVSRQVAEALADAPEGVPRVVAFPELYGLPLLFWLDAPEEVLKAKTALQAALIWLKTLGPKALALGPLGFYRERARSLWPLYRRAFEEAARRHAAYLFAGTWFAPRLDEEPSRGVYALSPMVYNWGFWVNPKGRLLSRVEKLRLMPAEKKALVRPGAWGGQAVKTAIGTLSALVCLDAFHEALVERADAAGAWLLVQPSANPAPWDAPWPPDRGRTEGEAWLAEGLPKKLVGRENLRFGLNPMLVGRFYETLFEGKSNVAAPGEVLAIVEDARTPGAASALVEL